MHSLSFRPYCGQDSSTRPPVATNMSIYDSSSHMAVSSSSDVPTSLILLRYALYLIVLHLFREQETGHIQHLHELPGTGWDRGIRWNVPADFEFRYAVRFVGVRRIKEGIAVQVRFHLLSNCVHFGPFGLCVAKVPAQLELNEIGVDLLDLLRRGTEKLLMAKQLYVGLAEHHGPIHVGDTKAQVAG